MPKSSVSEGVSKFLFLKSKYPGTKYIEPVISKRDWFNEIFLQCIFSTKEEFITDNDLKKIKLLFTQNVKNAEWIIFSLLRRWREDFYPKLNIKLLFIILDELDDARYEELVRPILGESYGWRDEYLPIDNIASQIGEILKDNERLSKCPSVLNLTELLIYLFTIGGRSSLFPAHDVFHSFAFKNTDMAIVLLKKHATTRSKAIASGIKDMLSILCRPKEEK